MTLPMIQIGPKLHQMTSELWDSINAIQNPYSLVRQLANGLMEAKIPLFSRIFADFSKYFDYLPSKREPFSLNLSYIVTQISMMQLIYFPFPLVPNECPKIGYFGPFSQFLTVFFVVFVEQLLKVPIKREPFCTIYLLYCNTTIDNLCKIFFYSIST